MDRPKGATPEQRRLWLRYFHASLQGGMAADAAADNATKAVRVAHPEIASATRWVTALGDFAFRSAPPRCEACHNRSGWLVTTCEQDYLDEVITRTFATCDERCMDKLLAHYAHWRRVNPPTHQTNPAAGPYR